jgi:hypothetical protein
MEPAPCDLILLRSLHAGVVMTGIMRNSSLLFCALSCVLNLGAQRPPRHAPAPDATGPAQTRAHPASVGVAYPGSTWPSSGGVATVYYFIEPTSGDTANLTTAISTFDADFPNIIQWVQLESVGSGSPNYVDINLDPGDTSGECEANEGYEAMQGQPMEGSGSCTVTTLLHEMGHVIGLWHEQSRADRDTYVTVNYSNVIKGSWSNFEIDPDNHQILTPYDYASVMEYPAWSLSRNGGPVIESIPPGIPLQGADGVPGGGPADYSAADKEAIERLYGAAPKTITITSNPVGLKVEVDGKTITTPQTYSWPLESSHTLSAPAGVQSLTGDVANSTTPTTFYYTYGRWNDSTAQTHTISVTPGNGSPAFPTTSPQVATYSANFIQLVPYTATNYPASEGLVSIAPLPQSYAGTASPGAADRPLDGAAGNASPGLQAPGSGQVFLVARQQATLTATAEPGWSFYEFNNAPFWLPGGLGANPKTFYVPDTGNPIDTTAEFSNAPVFTVDVSPDSFSSNLYAYVDGDFWYTPKNFSAYYDDYSGDDWSLGTMHTIDVDADESPYSVNSRYAFSEWSDAGAQSHTIQVPGSSASYIATLTPQFAPATNFSYPPCGGSASLAPASPTGDGFYPTGQSLQYSAAPDMGWTFAGWTYDLTGTANPANLTANDETLVFANFNTTDSPLTLAGVSPVSVNAGSPAFTLTLNGTGFTPQSLVWINGNYPTVTYISATELQVTVTAAQVAAPAALEVYVENFPSGWDGCAVFGYATFLVDNPTGQAACMRNRGGSPAVITTSGPGCSPPRPIPVPGPIPPPPSSARQP